ncbi:MAG: EutN/CcmL family microcompartment protein [Acidobacteria bacterium]|nr:EutN/CcmL family microcompartment protein [Acidobacteriota bacterium]
MILGRVIGTVVATRKDEKLAGKKLLVVRTLDPEAGEEESYSVAIDTVGAGVGETVICVSGSSARLATGMKDHPVDTAIVGIVDSVKLEKLAGTQKGPTKAKR